jgi:hypothetical protein
MVSTTFDDEPLIAEAAEGILTAAPEPAPAEPAPAPKRGRGRPPGAKNKPKLPGAPPPAPGRRPRTTTRRPTAKGPTTEQKIVAAWGIPVAALAIAGSTLNNDALKADALTLEAYAAGAGKALAPLADVSPGFAGLLDRLSGDATPWVAAAMFGLSLGAQLAVNHGIISARAVSSFGAVPREAWLQQQPAPAAAADVQEPEQPPAPAPAAQVTDPWAEGTLPPDWQ